MLRILTGAAPLRRASAQMLTDAGPPAQVAANFPRLAAYPFGTLEVDDETGQSVFEWTDRAWASRQAGLEDAARRARLEAAMARSEAAGHGSLALFYLVELGGPDDLAAAEALVRERLRLLLLTTHRVTYQALLETPFERLADHPNLLLLLAELHVRRTGSAPSVRRYLERAAELLEAEHLGAAIPEDGVDAPGFESLRAESRLLFAVVGLGDRPRARGLLARILALRFATLMREHANPRSPTAIAEHMTALTQEIFAGLDALVGAGGRSAAALGGVLASARGDHRPLRRLESLRLSWAEKETVALLRAGYTNPQIAAHRFVTINTVRTQLRLLFRKLGATDRVHAVALAEELGLVDDLPGVPPPR